MTTAVLFARRGARETTRSRSTFVKAVASSAVSTAVSTVFSTVFSAVSSPASSVARGSSFIVPSRAFRRPSPHRHFTAGPVSPGEAETLATRTRAR
jgi:hypothetical protein